MNLTKQLDEFDEVKASKLVSENSLPAGLNFRKLVKRSGDLKEKMLYQYDNGKNRGVTTRLPELDKHMTWKEGFLYTISGWPQHGKSEWMNYLAILKAKFDGWKTLIYTPESDPADEYMDQIAHSLLGQNTDKRYHYRASKVDYSAAIDFLHEYFIIITDDDLEEQGVVNSPENLREIARYFRAEDNINIFIKDPWNQLTHNLEMRDDKYLQEQLKQEKRLATALSIHNVILVHPKEWSGPVPETGLPMPKENNLAGGAMWRNKSDVIGMMHRPYYFQDRTDPRAEFATLKVKKQNLVGKPGTVECVFNPKENRYYINGKCPLVKEGLQPDTVQQDVDYARGANMPASLFDETPPF